MNTSRVCRWLLLAGTMQVGWTPALAQVAASAPGSTDPAAEIEAEEIVVQGVRQALADAQAIKRNSESIVDALVAQDIGKLPDVQANDALARLPGIQVTRNNDEATGVLVRGLPNVTTTFNGRELFTVENRRANLQDFPAGALAGIEVYKSATADQVEPGLAGLINVRTRRPFDFDGFALSGAIRGSWNEQTRVIDPTVNLMVSDRWDTGIGEMGLLVHYARTQTRYRNAVRFINSNITAIDRQNGNAADDIIVETPGIAPSTRVPEEIGLYYSRGKRIRPSVSSTFQWRPNSDLEFYVEGLWQGYRGRNADDRFGLNIARTSEAGAPPTFSNVVLDPDNPTRIIGLTKSGGHLGETYRSTTDDQGDTYQVAGGFRWNTGRAEITGDVAWTQSVYTFANYSIDGQTRDAITTNVDFVRNNGVSFDLNGYDALNPDNWIWRGFYNNRGRSEGEGTQWRIDVKLDTELDVLTRIDTGFRMTTRTARTRSGDRYGWTGQLGIPLGSLPSGELEVVSDGFRSNDQPFQNWMTPSRAGVRDNFDALRLATLQALRQQQTQFPEQDWWAADAQRWESEQPVIPPRSGFDADEKSYSFYAQGRYDFDTVGAPIDGNFGVRIVNTDGAYSGTFQLTNAQGVVTLEPLTSKQNYVTVLPTFGARWKITPKLQLRLGATRTFTRPSFGELNPTLTVSVVNRSGGNNPTELRNAFISGGNPRLNPLYSNNYDATLEYYFAKTGSVSAAVFRRDLNGFISNYTRDVPNYPGYGLVSLSQPENAGKGRIDGAEVAGQMFFDFLPGWLSGFGVQANATYLQAKYALPAVLGVGTPQVKIPGVSDWAYNLSGFYEKGPLTARLSYNRRSSWVNGYTRNNNEDSFIGEATRPVARLDFGISYDVFESLALTFEVSNILAQPFENYRYYNRTDLYARDVREEGRYISAGARFRL